MNAPEPLLSEPTTANTTSATAGAAMAATAAMADTHEPFNLGTELVD